MSEIQSPPHPPRLNGHWWVPESPQSKLEGVLTVASDGEATVELTVPRGNQDRVFTDELRPFQNDLDRLLPLLHGSDRDGNAWTLYHLTLNKRTDGRRLLYEFDVNASLEGIHAGLWSSTQVKGLTCEMDCLAGWLGLDATTRQSDTGQVHLDRDLLNSLAFDVGNGQHLAFNLALTTSSNTTSVGSIDSVESRWQMDWRFEKPLTIEGTQEAVLAARRLLGLFTLKKVTPRRMRLNIDGVVLSDAMHYSRGAHLHMALPGPPEVEKPYHDFYAPVKRHEVIHDFAALYTRWLNYHTKHRVVFDLYDSVVYHDVGFMHHQFLFLAQALEVYHASHYSKRLPPDPSFGRVVCQLLSQVPAEYRERVKKALKPRRDKRLSDRLRELLERHANSMTHLVPDAGGFAERVALTRNHYTHWSKSGSANLIAEIDLPRTTEILRRLLEACVFEDLGLGVEPIRRRFAPPLPTYCVFPEP